MLPIRQMLRVASAAVKAMPDANDLARVKSILAWQAENLAAARQANLPKPPAMRAFDHFFSCEGNSIGRMYGSQMIGQFNFMAEKIGLTPAFNDLDEWLLTMNYIIQRAPVFNADKNQQFFFPMSSLFVFYMFTISGAALFRTREFNLLLTQVLDTWCRYLDSPESKTVLNPDQAVPATEGWLSPAAQDQFCLRQCANFANSDDPAEPYWGFESFNAFFHREWNLADYRPLARADDDRVVVSANDGTVYRIARQVERCTAFWTKGQNYSLVDMLDHSAFVDDFVGGDVMQSFLDGSDYHRWHAPISGKVVEVKNISGLTFSELLSEGFDLSAGTESQGYQAMVNTRGLVIIENPNLGKVAVLPIGITEISSVTINVKLGDELKKGDELGYFSYGGSTLVLVFEKGMIEHFEAQEPKAGEGDSLDCKVEAVCKASDGCLMVRSQIATARLR